MPERILEILTEEETVYAEVKELVRQKLEALVAKDMERVEGITKEEEKRIEVISRLEKERMEVLAKMAASLGKSPELVRSADVEQLLGQEKGRTFRETVDRLKTLLEEIRQTNELNTRLLAQSLDVINYTLKVLTSMENRLGGYGRDGETPKKSPSGSSRIFDQKG